MSEQDPALETFSKFIVALEPWLGEVVVVGGWAHRLYRLDPRARKLDYLPLTTLETLCEEASESHRFGSGASEGRRLGQHPAPQS
jgi:hypothetical protein